MPSSASKTTPPTTPPAIAPALEELLEDVVEGKLLEVAGVVADEAMVLVGPIPEES